MNCMLSFNSVCFHCGGYGFLEDAVDSVYYAFANPYISDFAADVVQRVFGEA